MSNSNEGTPVAVSFDWPAATDIARHDLALDFVKDLAPVLHASGAVSLATRQAPRVKGEMLTIGTVAVSIAAVKPVISAIVMVLKPYFSRHPALTVKIARGRNSVTIQSRDISPQAVSALIDRVAATLQDV